MRGSADESSGVEIESSVHADSMAMARMEYSSIELSFMRVRG